MSADTPAVRLARTARMLVSYVPLDNLWQHLFLAKLCRRRILHTQESRTYTHRSLPAVARCLTIS